MAFNAARIIISALIILALNGRPEMYHAVLRWLILGIAGYGAWLAGERGLSTWTTVFGVTMLVYNPIFPVILDETVWPLVHIAAAVVMLTSIPAVRSGEPIREEREPVVVKFPPRKRI